MNCTLFKVKRRFPLTYPANSWIAALHLILAESVKSKQQSAKIINRYVKQLRHLQCLQAENIS